MHCRLIIIILLCTVDQASDLWFTFGDMEDELSEGIELETKITPFNGQTVYCLSVRSTNYLTTFQLDFN